MQQVKNTAFPEYPTDTPVGYQVVATHKQTGARRFVSYSSSMEQAFAFLRDYDVHESEGMLCVMPVPLCRPPLAEFTEFTERYFPYQTEDHTVLSEIEDMYACFEYADINEYEDITPHSLDELHKQAPDRDRSREPSWHQVHVFDTYVGQYLTFRQAAIELEDYCLALAVCNYPTDAPPLPDSYIVWAANLLDRPF